MGHQSSMILAALLLAACAFGSWKVHASDPELITDYAVPPGANASTLNGSFFTSPALRSPPLTSQTIATVTAVNVGNLPALLGLGVSSALVQFAPGAVNVPHLHPRGTELFLVLEGILEVGFIDTTNKLFTNTLQAGDSFVFPKGLVHFQRNSQTNCSVKAVAAFSSSNPGRVTLPAALFQSGIDILLLVKSFGVPSKVIKELEAAIVK